MGDIKITKSQFSHKQILVNIRDKTIKLGLQCYVDITCIMHVKCLEVCRYFNDGRFASCVGKIDDINVYSDLNNSIPVNISEGTVKYSIIKIHYKIRLIRHFCYSWD